MRDTADRAALRVLVALAATAALLSVAACGGGAAQPLTPVAGDAGGGSNPVRIRMALPPDPVWTWLADSGTVAQWEAEHNIRIEATNPFDQFSAFAGGHADVVVVNALEVTQFVEQSDRDPLIVGQFTKDRSIVAVKRTSRAESLDDLVEARITVDNSLGSTLLWGLIADELHDLEFQIGGRDFELVVVEAASAAELVLRGDADACVCLPDFSVTALSEGTLRPLYGGRSAAQVYANSVLGIADEVPVADVFVVDRRWHEMNREAVQALLGLWEVGLRDWAADKERYISDYPHLFAVQGDADIAWMTDYVRRHDWVAHSVGLDSIDESIHTEIFTGLQRIGLIDADAGPPRMDLAIRPSK